MSWLAKIDPNSEHGVTITKEPSAVLLSDSVRYSTGGWGTRNSIRTEARIEARRGFFETKAEAIRWADKVFEQQIAKQEQFLAITKAKREQFRLAYDWRDDE